MSREMAWERMGWRSYKLAQQQRIQETLLEAELQNEVMRNNQQVIQEMQQQAMEQVQQQMSQAQQASQLNGASQPTAEGTDMRAGGTPYAMANPGGTREALTGQTASGGQVMQ
jgi:hypothetical protein